MRKLLAALLLALALLVASSPAAALGDCTTCGKHIYFGERCVSCTIAAKRAEHSHPCVDCKEPILFGERCARCALAKAAAQLARPCADCGTTIHLGTRCSSCRAKRFQASLDGALERASRASSSLGDSAKARLTALLKPEPETEAREKEALAKTEAGWLERAREWSRQTGGRVAEGTKDLALERRASLALGAALEVATAVEGTKKHLAKASLERALALSVESDVGRTSLGDLATAKLLAAAPALEGTDLAKDPAAVLASLIVVDPMAFMIDLKLVPTDDGAVSILDALAEGGTSDPETALACITLLEATHRLQQGQDITRSLRDISRALELLTPAPAE